MAWGEGVQFTQVGNQWLPASSFGSGGCLPSGQQIVQADHTNWSVPCYNHVISEFTVYEDVITANCATCGDRITFNTFPGGALSLRTRYLLEQFIIEGEVSEDTLGKLLKLKELLALEIEELEVVSARIETIQDGVREQLEA